MKLKRLTTITLSCAILLSSIITTDAYDVPKVEKIIGKDNYETAALIADKQNYSTAILVNLDNSIADGLSSSGLSGTVNAPILLTKKDNIPEVTMTRINKAKKIYIIGGVNSVSSSVENNLKSKGLVVIRIQGKDRIDTSLNVANEIKKFNNPKYVYFTNGFKGEADAISVSFLAAQKKCPIIQTDGKSTTYKVNNNQISWVIGGNVSMSESFVNKMDALRIGGVDRFDTNQKLIYFAGEEESGSDESYYENAFHIADGYNLTNALVVSPIAKYAPTVLVSKSSDKSLLEDVGKITIVGSIDKEVESRLTKVDPLVEDLLGVWKMGDNFYSIEKFTFSDSTESIYSANYDIIKINRDDVEWVEILINDGNEKRIAAVGFTDKSHTYSFVGYLNKENGKFENARTYKRDSQNSWVSMAEAEQIAIDACLNRYKNEITRKDISIKYVGIESDLIGVGEPTYAFQLKISYDNRYVYRYVYIEQTTGTVYGNLNDNLNM